MKHWNRKHAKAVHVPSKCVQTPVRKYRYGNLIRLGNGTDFLLYLNALARGKAYYDPGIKMEHASTTPRIKRRSQFRMRTADLPALYHSMETVDVTASSR
jgi:hypothetical protein